MLPRFVSRLALISAIALGVCRPLAARPLEAPRPLPAALAAAASNEPLMSYRFAPVGDVSIYRSTGPIRGVVLLLSGDGGWNLGVVDMTKALTRQGVAVAGVSTPAFQHGLEAGKDGCINPNFALSALAQDVEHKLGLARYQRPILAGYSSGATLVYGALALAPPGLYAGGVSLGFGPDIAGHKPWCQAEGFRPAPISKPQHGWLLPAGVRLPAPWLVLQGLKDQVVSPSVTHQFVVSTPQAQLIELPKVGHGFAVQANWLPQFSKAFAELLAVKGEAPSLGEDLPITLVVNPSAPSTDLMAVLYSGDGGWAGLDQSLAATLAAHGVPVVGVDSLKYFWTAKTPAAAGQDAGRIIGHFSSLWHRPRVVMIGYSFGAATLPFIVDNLPQTALSTVARVSMLGMGATADFQFHLTSWLDIASAKALPTTPAVERLRGLSLQCIRGADETDSICPALPPGLADRPVLPGGHHFDGNASLLATTILRGFK